MDNKDLFLDMSSGNNLKYGPSTLFQG